MSTILNNLLNQCNTPLDIDGEKEDLFAQVQVEQNLWRLPLDVLAPGINMSTEEERNQVLQSLSDVRQQSRANANWLILKALDNPDIVIEQALNRYGKDVFLTESWTKFPELLDSPSALNELKKENEELKAEMERMRTIYSDELRAQQERIEELMRIPKELPFGLFQLYNSAISLIHMMAPDLKINSLEMKSDGLHIAVSEHIHTLEPSIRRIVQELLDNLKKESLETCFVCGRKANPEYQNYTDSEIFPLCDDCFQRLEETEHPEKTYSLEEAFAELDQYIASHDSK